MKVKIKGVIIGDREISHTIEMPNYSEQMRDIYVLEFLKRQYPDKIQKITDVKHEIVG